jgi:hypothetical protein
MKIKLLDDAELIGSDSTRFFGYRVMTDAWTDLSEAPANVQAKAMHNPTFIVAPSDGQTAVAAPVADAKASVIAELEEMGVDFDRRLGVEKLRGLLADALEAQEDAD